MAAHVPSAKHQEKGRCGWPTKIYILFKRVRFPPEYNRKIEPTSAYSSCFLKTGRDNVASEREEIHWLGGRGGESPSSLSSRHSEDPWSSLGKVLPRMGSELKKS